MNTSLLQNEVDLAQAVAIQFNTVSELLMQRNRTFFKEGHTNEQYKWLAPITASLGGLKMEPKREGDKDVFFKQIYKPFPSASPAIASIECDSKTGRMTVHIDGMDFFSTVPGKAVESIEEYTKMRLPSMVVDFCTKMTEEWRACCYARMIHNITPKSKYNRSPLTIVDSSTEHNIPLQRMGITTRENYQPYHASQDCGKCQFCLDKPKFGGPGKLRQQCQIKNASRNRNRKRQRKNHTTDDESRGSNEAGAAVDTTNDFFAMDFVYETESLTGVDWNDVTGEMSVAL